MSENNKNTWVKDLRKSPIFNMSLSSKELFHSNFIAWIMESYPLEMGHLFSKILNIDEEEIKKNSIEREKNNIDLSFALGNTLVFIENKVKSIAYKEQLDKYAKRKIENGKNAKYILLSLSKPSFIEKKSYITPDSIEWIYLSYEDFLESGLSPLCTNITDTYHRNLIEDYISFVEIIDKQIIKKIEYTDVIKLYTNDTAENQLLTEIWSLRMHDIFQKAVFELLAKNVYDKLKTIDNKLKIHLGNRDKNKPYHGYICISSGMTRAEGLIHIEYIGSTNDRFGVQIQASRYKKYMVGDENPKHIWETATKLENTLLGFDKEFFEYTESELIPNKENSRLKKLVDKIKVNKDEISLKFNRYLSNGEKSLFLYKYVNLKSLKLSGEKQKNEELVEFIVSDMLGMIKTFESYKKID